MKIVFFSNFLNHHQALVADELYRMTDGNYTFVEVMLMPEWIAKSGYPDYTTKQYLLQAWKSEESMRTARQLAVEADVALFAGFEVLDLEKLRIASSEKITFDVSERWLKRGLLNILSPRILKQYFAYKNGGWKEKPVYKLCSSAFAAADHRKLNMYKDRCYKWGYFTHIDKTPSSSLSFHTDQERPFRIMWCSRFLWWKHPELPIQLAASLKKKGYFFHIDMFGSGKMLDKMKALATKLGVNDVLSFCGNKPNAEILEEMRQHHIFLFTSDKNEGWGAVATEAMSQGCVVVGSDAIGSVPYLITNNSNGIIFESCNLNSLVEKVANLLDNPKERCVLSRNGVETIQKEWSPKNAATSLLQLISDLQNGRRTSNLQGPCSLA